MSAFDQPTATLHEARGNLKPAPFALTPPLVGMLVGDRPAAGEAIALLGKLSDQAERREDPTRPSTWCKSTTEANDA